MTNSVALQQPLLTQQLAGNLGMLIGQLIAIDSENRPVVSFFGCNEPCVAQVLSGVLVIAEINKAELPMSVLLAVSAIDVDSPIVLGKIDSCVTQAPKMYDVELPARGKRHIKVDGEHVVLEAKKELTLTCGKSSITLNKNGKVVIKGIDLVNRAARSNKLKGASVNIN